MPTLFKLLEQNRNWAEETAKKDPTYFPGLASQQSPGTSGKAVVSLYDYAC
jgi:carbonic anhydrase